MKRSYWIRFYIITKIYQSKQHVTFSFDGHSDLFKKCDKNNYAVNQIMKK